MTNEVYFDPLVGGDSSRVTDDDNVSTGLLNGGSTLRLVPMFQQVVNVAKWVLARANEITANTGLAQNWASLLTTTVDGTNYSAKQYALNALGFSNSSAASANDALNYATALTSTSTDSKTLGATGNVTFTTQAGKQYVPGQFVTVAYDSSNYMWGDVVSYSDTTLVVNITVAIGSGTYSSWSIAISGLRGATGAGANINIGNPTNVTGLFVGDGAAIHQAVSGVDFKTLNSQSILGSGNVVVGVPDYLLFNAGII